MRSLPLQCGKIQIASSSGERRQIQVSGLVKARLLWLFRNFYVLDFPILDKKQQQLIAQVWNSGSSTDSKQPASKEAGPAGTAPTKVRSIDDNAPDPILSSLDLIGTVEGYLPQLYPATASTKEFRVGNPIKPPAENLDRIWMPLRSRLSGGLLIPAIWTAMGALVLGGAITLGPRILTSEAPRSTPRSIPPPHVSAASDAKPIRPPLPALPKPSPIASASAAAPVSAPRRLPNAMASNASSPDFAPPRTRLTVPAKPPAAPCVSSSLAPPPSREAMIRVTVDREGHAQDFQILQGDRNKIPAALRAAKRFSFQPCVSSSDCDHLLKFTDYGDASVVQRID